MKNIVSLYIYISSNKTTVLLLSLCVCLVRVSKCEHM